MTTTARTAREAGQDDDRRYWGDVLAAGGVTAIPRWTRHPVPGVAVYEAAVPEHVTAASRRLADELAVPLGSVRLAAHAGVLSALTGEQEVTTGYVPAGGSGSPLPCRLPAAPGSWRSLVRRARRAESELLAHRDFPVGALLRELGAAGPPSEVLFAPEDDGGGELTGDAVLRVGFAGRGGRGRSVLRLTYRTDALDADAAARIAGYHLTALTLATDDPDTPDAAHERQSLLSTEELRFQLEELTGPCRELPDRRVHELFEQRVRAHPDAVAAVHGGRQWTYRKLDARANQLARALLSRGLRREDPVAVVTERNLDWAAAVLGVLKAGGAYLPVEPHFPADRVARTLARSGCRLVVTEPGSTATLDQALAALPAGTTPRKVLVDGAYAEGHPDHDLGVPVAPGQLAYVYFTSGSTGEPKGAMCEHAGMLNHIRAKIEDLGVGEGHVVAQTAPQCFDISLWQLLSALVAGGRTLLVEQEAILDVPRFVDAIDGGRVCVLQLVPSYLEAVVSYLERHPRELPHLRCVSVTGEPLRCELVRRWFAVRPGVRLVNAYGLTETSDDTNHEVLDRAPEDGRVPLGRPVANVGVRVVDEHLSPVPLGAPGELVFSGVCVGRGYVGDPERTRAAFPADPEHPGGRLYRSGDYGRWLPDGRLEFLGRRDAQVKVRGFRIELGEVENALLRVPGVRDGAVVVADGNGDGDGRGDRLVAFYARGSDPAGRPLEDGVLRDRMSAWLPAYMVPSAFHERESLPLTPNGKTDRKKLAALAAQADPRPAGAATATGASDVEAARPVPAAPAQGPDAPRTPTERRIAAAWADVLGVPVPLLGRHDHFFDRGGTSLSAVRLAIALDRTVTLRDLTRHPVLADLARLVDARAAAPPDSAAPPPAPTP